MKISKIYETDKNGFTVDGYPLPKSPYKTIPDVFTHPGPLPHLKPSISKSIAPMGDQTRKALSSRIASFDEQHAKELKRYYGEDSLRITWANPIEPAEPEQPKPLTEADIAEMHGIETLRRIHDKD
jgi:hypothetical protein